MPRYKVNFIDKEHKTKYSLLINALSKKEAFVKAEDIYRLNNWQWRYTDLYADLFP